MAKKQATKQAKAKGKPSEPPKLKRKTGKQGGGGADRNERESVTIGSAVGKNNAMCNSAACDDHLAISLGEVAKLDRASAIGELENLVCGGIYEGWLFESRERVERLMFHLMISLHEAATGELNGKVENIRDSKQAQESLAEIALYFIKAKPPKKYGSQWLIDCFDLPHFSQAWGKRVWRAKPPNEKKLDFVLQCMLKVDDLLLRLIDRLSRFDKRRRKWKYLPLSAASDEIQRLRLHDAVLAKTVESILDQIYPNLPHDAMAFESYPSKSLPDYLERLMPWIESRWRSLSLEKRQEICGSKASGQQTWGCVAKHMRQAVKIVVQCTIAVEEPISTLTLSRVKDFVNL